MTEQGSAKNRMQKAAAARPIFFIHIEKTGGTSIRSAALDYFSPERVVTFYGAESRNTSAVVKDIFYSGDPASREEKLSRLSSYITEQEIRLFSSHIKDFWKLDCFDPRHAVTLLREPAERLVSNYLFEKRLGTLRHPNFRAYMEDARNQNVQARRFRQIPLSALRLVGITDEFDDFVQAFNREFGLAFKVLHEKKASLADRLASRVLLTKHRDEIEALNSRDYRRYEQAKRLWADARKRLLG